MQASFAATKLFFDRAAVINSMDRQQVRLLNRVGGNIRTIARRSMRKRKRPSRPGEPPSAHGAQLLKKFLFYSYDPSSRSVVIGPERLPKLGLAPKTLEHGGTTQISTRVKGRSVLKTINVAARPFMGPALLKSKDNIPSVWKNVASQTS